MLQYFRSWPYSLVAVNTFPHCGQIHVRAVFFHFAGFGCLWFHAVLHFSEQNFFLLPLAFCENNPPQFGQMSTYSSGLITSSHKWFCPPFSSDCVELKTEPADNLGIYPKFTGVFYENPSIFPLVPVFISRTCKGKTTGNALFSRLFQWFFSHFPFSDCVVSIILTPGGPLSANGPKRGAAALRYSKHE